MADQGTFDYWIGDRITFGVMVPSSGSTGDFDQWISDRIGFAEYAESQGPIARVRTYSLNTSRGVLAPRSRL